MLTFDTQIEHESKTTEGVRFTVRVLNKIQRAKRDLPLLPHQAAITRLSNRLTEAAKDEADPVAAMQIDAEIGLLMNIHIKPAFLQAGLISIDGATGIKNAADLIDHGPDDLIDEIYIACAMASGLTVDQTKNSSSPSDSPDPVAADEQNTNAATAAP